MARGTLQPQMDITLVVLGKRRVGKTALIKKAVTGEFTERYDATTEGRYSMRRTLGNQTFSVQIIDTGSEDTYGVETLRNGDGFLLLYDVSDRSSFEAIEALYDKIREAKTPILGNCPDSTLPPAAPLSVVVVGNQIDRSDERKVSHKEGMKKAEEMDCGFHETTAKGSVEQVFFDVVQRRNLPLSCDDMRDPSGPSEEGSYGWTCGLTTLFTKYGS